jgi:electron transfer flavoprotein alpha/beta subunit
MACHQSRSAMRILVYLKQVFDPATIRVSSRGDLATQDGVRIINAASLCALEEALRLKDSANAEVTVLTLGGTEEEDALREGLAMGADKAILLSDPAFSGGDASATSYAVAQAVRTAGNIDLVLSGDGSAEDESGPICPAVAEMLGWPQITAALSLSTVGGHATACQALEDGDRRISVPLPAVVTIGEHANAPRLAPVASIMTVYAERTVEKWNAAGIAADTGKIGAAGSPTEVRRRFAPDPLPKADILAGTPQEAARALVARLRRRNLLREV